MPKPIASFYLTLCPDQKPFVEKHLKTHKVFVHTGGISFENIHPDTEVLGIFVDSKITSAVMDAMPKLRLIVALSVGFDHIDLVSAKKKGIVVANIPDYGENTVAEHALALLFALTRNIVASTLRIKNSRYDCDCLRGVDMAGKTIGVIGTGRIGLRFISLLTGLGMKVLAFDPFPKKEWQKKFNFKYASFERILKESDFVSLHVPLLPATKHLISKKTISKMKKGVYIINTARGGIVNTKDALAGLNSGKIGAMAADVFEGEDTLRHGEGKKNEDVSVTKEFLSHEKVIATPHNAFNSHESVARMFDSGMETIERFYQKKKLKNRLV